MYNFRDRKWGGGDIGNNAGSAVDLFQNTPISPPPPLPHPNNFVRAPYATVGTVWHRYRSIFETD
jgi:hypothetical protein